MMNVSHETLPDKIVSRRPLKPTDGRVRRGAAQRQRIVDGVLTLVARGHYQPLWKDLATACGLNRASILHHFGTKEALMRHVALVHAKTVVASLGIVNPGLGGLWMYEAESLAIALLVGERVPL